MLPRPLRARRGRRDRRHAGLAAPAHRAADGELAVQRRDRAPRQRRQPRPGPPRRAQPDDRPAAGSATPRCPPTRPPSCTASSCGSRCPRPAGHAEPGFEHYAPPRGDGARLGRPGLPRLHARLDLAGQDLLATARRRDRARAGGTSWSLPLDPAYEHGVLLDSGDRHGRRRPGQGGRARVRRPRRHAARPSPPTHGGRLLLLGGAAVRRADRDVVELRRPQPRRDRRRSAPSGRPRSRTTVRSSRTPSRSSTVGSAWSSATTCRRSPRRAAQRYASSPAADADVTVSSPPPIAGRRQRSRVAGMATDPTSTSTSPASRRPSSTAPSSGAPSPATPRAWSTPARRSCASTASTWTRSGWSTTTSPPGSTRTCASTAGRPTSGPTSTRASWPATSSWSPARSGWATTPASPSSSSSGSTRSPASSTTRASTSSTAGSPAA